MRLIILLSILVSSVLTVQADSIELHNGGSLQCDILQQEQNVIVVLYRSSILRVPQIRVKAVHRDAVEPPSKAKSTDTMARMPDYATIVKTVARQPWATDLRQIPATVIGSGILRNVPYKSHRAGMDYEINIYGDPNSPAGFEIGLHRAILDDDAKKNCIECVCMLLGEKGDRNLVHGLSWEQDQKTRNGVTFEITPPTAPDAYGGWWVSTYNEKLLSTMRANDEELAAITVLSDPPSAISKKHIGNDRSSHGENASNFDDWSPQDLAYSRNLSTSRSKVSSGGQVYVRGYYRKDGTYVHSHTRNAPHRK